MDIFYIVPLILSSLFLARFLIILMFYLKCTYTPRIRVDKDRELILLEWKLRIVHRAVVVTCYPNSMQSSERDAVQHKNGFNVVPCPFTLGNVFLQIKLSMKLPAEVQLSISYFDIVCACYLSLFCW